jgi:hypothetical protein
MTGFSDPIHELRRRISALEKRLANLSVDDIWQPLVSCSTSDGVDVELQFDDGSVRLGHFYQARGCWVVKTATGRAPAEQYPRKWRKSALTAGERRDG